MTMFTAEQARLITRVLAARSCFVDHREIRVARELEARGLVRIDEVLTSRVSKLEVWCCTALVDANSAGVQLIAADVEARHAAIRLLVELIRERDDNPDLVRGGSVAGFLESFK